MRKQIVLIVVVAALFLIQSCKGKPFACFSTEPDEDNLHVNQPITFRANCSTNADTYYWEFYDKEDSTEYGFSVTKTFADTGEVKVFMLVVGGGKTSATERYITIRP